jgi:hypothetical protein
VKNIKYLYLLFQYHLSIFNLNQKPMKFNYLKVLFLLSCTNVVLAQTSKGAMGGAWYCSDTKEIFAITTDDDNSIQGRGVYYAKGNSKYQQMQIMTQTTTDEGYLLRCYDPAKPNMVYELKSMVMNYGTKIAMTRTGSRSKSYYFNNMGWGVPDTKGFGKMKPWETLRRSLYDKTWVESKRPNSPLTFKFAEGYAQAAQDAHTERFTVNDNTFDISTFLQAYGKVKIHFLFDEEWFLEVRDLDNKVLTMFSPK